MLWIADFSLARPWPLPEGYVGVLRYILDGTMPGKGMSKAEYDFYLANGKSVAWIHETGYQRALLGYAEGVAQAQQSFAKADSIGWPKDRPGYFSAEDPSRIAVSDWPKVEQFFIGAATIVPVSRLGGYGGPDLLDWLHSRGRITNGIAVETWGAVRPWMQLRQMYNPVPGAPSNLGGAVDPDQCLQADWGQVPSPIAETPHEENDVGVVDSYTARIDGSGIWDRVYIEGDGPGMVRGRVVHAWSKALGDHVSGVAPQDFPDKGSKGNGFAKSITFNRWISATGYLIGVVGTDNHPWWMWYDTVNGWNDIWTTEPHVLLDTATPGPTGPAGPTYDDSALRAELVVDETTVAKLSAAVASIDPAAGVELAALLARVAKVAADLVAPTVSPVAETGG